MEKFHIPYSEWPDIPYSTTIVNGKVRIGFVQMLAYIERMSSHIEKEVDNAKNKGRVVYKSDIE